jgi:hypothetical protein
MAEHEEMVLDVGACVRHLLDERHVEKVVLLGNCGGGSLVAYYQAQAKLPAKERIAKSPGGAPSHFPEATLVPAHGIAYVAPHRGQGKIMMTSIDAAVIDEADPLKSDPSLDIYNPANGFRDGPTWSEYSAEFVTRVREAQVARVQRLDDFARAQISASQSATDPRRRVHDPIMVVYRTMANPAYVDRNIEPSERDYGSLMSERPDLMNYAALGLARTCTPRAWLSTWSGLSSNADLVKNVAGITEPMVLVHAGADREIYPSDIAAIEAASASPDKRVVTLAGARHYFEPAFGEKHAPDVERVMDIVVPWIQERFA